ncbi:hypothetical protein P9112_011189 [Eukaryota sp. TZLM1-RC]
MSTSFLDDFSSSLQEFERFVDSDALNLQDLASAKLPYTPLEGSGQSLSDSPSLPHTSTKLLPSDGVLHDVYDSLDVVRDLVLSPQTSSPQHPNLSRPPSSPYFMEDQLRAVVVNPDMSEEKLHLVEKILDDLLMETDVDSSIMNQISDLFQFYYTHSASNLLLTKFLNLFIQTNNISLLLTLNTILKSVKFESFLMSFLLNSPLLFSSILVPILFDVLTTTTVLETKSLVVYALRFLNHYHVSDDVINYLFELLLSKTCSIKKSSIARTLARLSVENIYKLIDISECYPYQSIIEAVLLGLGGVSATSLEKSCVSDPVDIILNPVSNPAAQSVSFSASNEVSDCNHLIGDEELILEQYVGKKLVLNISVASISSAIRKSGNFNHSQSNSDELPFTPTDELWSFFVKSLSNSKEKVIIAGLKAMRSFCSLNSLDLARIPLKNLTFSAEVKTEFAKTIPYLFNKSFNGDYLIKLLITLLSDRFFKVKRVVIEACGELKRQICPDLKNKLIGKLQTFLLDSKNSLPNILIANALLTLNSEESFGFLNDLITSAKCSKLVQDLIEALYLYLIMNSDLVSFVHFIDLFSTSLHQLVAKSSSYMVRYTSMCHLLFLRQHHVMDWFDDVIREVNFHQTRDQERLPIYLQSRALLPLAYKFLREPHSILSNLGLKVLINGGPEGKLLLVEGALRDESPICRSNSITALRHFGASSLRIFLLGVLDGDKNVELSAIESLSAFTAEELVTFITNLDVEEVKGILTTVQNVLTREDPVEEQLVKNLRILHRFGTDFIINSNGNLQLHSKVCDSPFLL